MSNEVAKILLTYIAFMLMGSYAIYREKDLVRFERRVKRKVKKYARAFVWATEAYIAERKGKNMFVIYKTPGSAPERRHISNNFKAVAREIDSENVGVVDIGMGLKMFHDTDGFENQAAPCMTDGRADKIYYGDVIFVAVNSEGTPRCLTEREVKYVENYIKTYRADKLVS